MLANFMAQCLIFLNILWFAESHRLMAAVGTLGLVILSPIILRKENPHP